MNLRQLRESIGHLKTRISGSPRLTNHMVGRRWSSSHPEIIEYGRMSTMALTGVLLGVAMRLQETIVKAPGGAAGSRPC